MLFPLVLTPPRNSIDVMSDSPKPLTFPCRFFHFLSQAKRSHVGPDFFNIGQTFRLVTGFSNFSPAQRILTIDWPDRILLFMIHDNLINSVVFFLVHMFLRLLLY